MDVHLLCMCMGEYLKIDATYAYMQVWDYKTAHLINLRGLVIPAACDFPGQELVLSIIPLTSLLPTDLLSFFHGIYP